MSSLIEEALKLPKEEKVKLYYALQEDLEFDDDILAEDILIRSNGRNLIRELKMQNQEKLNLYQ